MQNIVFLIGRLVNDPELKKSENNKDYMSVTLAVQRSFKNSDGIYESDFIRCILWNGIATNVSDYCKKGDLVGVRGRIQTRNYENKDGNKVYVTEVVCDNMRMLESKNSGANSATYLEDYEPSNNGYTSDNTTASDVELNISEDDLPF